MKDFFRRIKINKALKKHRKVAVLYHHVGSSNPFTHKFHTVTLSRFKQQIESYQKNWDFVDEATFFSSESNMNQAILTFDDGYSETYRNVLPWLESKGIPSVFFVNGKVLEQGWLWRDALRWIVERNEGDKLIEILGDDSLDADLILTKSKQDFTIPSTYWIDAIKIFFERNNESYTSFNELNLYVSPSDLQDFSTLSHAKLGSHGYSHSVLASLTKEEQEADIHLNKAFLEREAKNISLSSTFSLPFGSKQSFNEQTLHAIRDAGYKYVMYTYGSDYFQGRNELAVNLFGLHGYKRFLPKQYY